MDARHVAANVCLQLHANVAPDEARVLAERIVWGIDRAGARGHSHGGPTDDEVHRLRDALQRRGVMVTIDVAQLALYETLIRGWGE